ncbi:hypothetical protein Scep_027601 [Stephania cephalantha]|uniref:Reverse transcriptase domain-containing protein n=1 Tax=Stephania cephalantha TaxID=152367 RepID=A0AAP0E8D6_9MAGN
MDTIMVDCIMKCVSTASLRVLCTTYSFSTSRRVMQGDSLPPYLFVLCMEHLAHGIQTSVEKNEWKGLKLRNDAPIISHIFFVDDMFLFTEASVEQAIVIKDILENFDLCSGQKVNKSKT